MQDELDLQVAHEEQLRVTPTYEFTPNIVDLKGVLNLIAFNSGNRDAILEAIGNAYLSDTAKGNPDPLYREEQRNKRAGNVLIAARGYGLFDSESLGLTELGESLLREPDDDLRHSMLSAHILKHHQGATVLAAVRDMRARGERVTKDSLNQELKRRGFQVPRASADPGRMRQWLDLAGVTSPSWDIDEHRLRDLIGVSTSELEMLERLSREQRAFLITLRHLATVHGTDPLPAKLVVDQAEQGWGSVFREDQLRSTIFNPLETAGWIVMSGRGTGRGGKGGNVAATDMLTEVDPAVLSVGEGMKIPSELLAARTKPISQIYEELQSADRNTKGIALELLAIRLATDLGLTPLRLRERSARTGGAEVDLIAEGVHLHFSRWLFQCKNTPSSAVGLADLAKEVGMAVLLKAHVVVMVTTGTFARSVVGYANSIAETTPLQVVLVDRKRLDNHNANGPTSLFDHFRKEAAQTLRLKRGQVDE